MFEDSQWNVAIETTCDHAETSADIAMHDNWQLQTLQTGVTFFVLYYINLCAPKKTAYMIVWTQDML